MSSGTNSRLAAARGLRCGWRGAALLVFCLALLGSSPLRAAKIEVQASVDRTRAGQAEPIQLVLSITSEESLSHVPAPDISLADFYVEGPAVSTRVEMVNFRTSYTRQLIYTLYARRPGRLVIPSARLEMGGQVYATKPIQLEIVSGSARGQGGDAGGGGDLEESLFVRVRADRRRAYVGQQVTLDYDLYYRFQLHNVGFKELPAFAGFWAKELFVAQQLQARRETLNGLAYNAAPLRQVALFATRAGKHLVEPLAISCEIPQQRSRRGGLFDDFVFGRATQTVLVKSESVEIEAVPLPQEGRPQEFSGAVGQFTMETSAQPAVVQVGDPVTLRVEIAGRGNMTAVRMPDISGAEHVEVYDPKVEEKEEIFGGVYGGRKIFEYILIPQSGGMMEIPPIRFAYFDPEREQYRVVDSGPIYINSQGSVAEREQEGYGLSRKDIEQVGEDIRHIKPDAAHLEVPFFLYRSGIYWAFQGALPLAFVGLLLYRRHQRRLQGDVAYARRKRARGEAHRRLKHARQLLGEGDAAAFHAEVQRALLAFLADRLNLAAAGLTRQTCAALLEERGVDAQVVEELGELLERCDFARFAAAAPSQRDMERAQERAEDLVGALEKAL